MKTSGTLVRKFKLKPQRRPIWAWYKLYLTPKRYHLKQYRLDYQLLFRKGACACRPDLSLVEIEPKHGNKSAFFTISLSAPKKLLSIES